MPLVPNFSLAYISRESDGPRIDSRWCHWIFQWNIPSDRTMALGSTQPLVKISTRNIPGGKGGRWVRLTTLPPSCAECHEIWEPKLPGTLWATPGLLLDSFTFTYISVGTPKNTQNGFKLEFKQAKFWSLLMMLIYWSKTYVTQGQTPKVY